MIGETCGCGMPWSMAGADHVCTEQPVTEREARRLNDRVEDHIAALEKRIAALAKHRGGGGQ